MFRLMTSKTKDKWRCPTCVKKDVKHVAPPSPASRRMDTADPLQDDDNKLECVTYKTQEDNDNVTMRKKIVINVQTENTFQSLSEEEILNISSVPSEEDKLNRSCPERTINTYYDIEEKNMMINNLENKLGSAEEEIDNLLLENSTLKKIITDYEQKIRCLNDICKGPSTSAKKNNNRLSKTATLTSTPKPCMKPLHNILPNAPDNPIRMNTILNTQNTPTTQSSKEEVNGNKQQQSLEAKTGKTSARHNVLLLADETGRHLRERLQRILGNDYQVTAVIKPNATLEQIVLSNLSWGQKFTKNDYVIILAGSHDYNITEFQSALYNSIGAFKNTNVLYGEISKNHFINKFKLNKLIEIISCNMENFHYSKLSFYRNNQLNRTNSCRWLISDIFLLEHTDKHYTKIKNVREKVETVSTQTDVFFRDD